MHDDTVLELASSFCPLFSKTDIRDFELGLDTIGPVGTGLTAGAFDPGRFFAVGQTVTGTAAALLYDQAHGVLYFDADGSGAGAALGITLVTPNTALTATSVVAA